MTNKCLLDTEEPDNCLRS